MSDTGLKRRVQRMIDRLDREDVCMHGFILSVDGREKAVAYYAPFREGQPHRMYSVSKTLTGLAIGLLADKGQLALDDRIAAYFPDLLPPEPDERLLRLTLRDMLRMATCYRATVYREGTDDDWTKPFFTAPATHEPGMIFHYDTGCSQTLAALVKRLSGLEVIDYLNQNLFARIGATDEKCWLRDPSGACQGGTGLCMSLRDLHKTARAVMRGGDGVLPKWYCTQMGQCHIETPLQEGEEERYGYGWQCWRTRAGYAMFGLGGQLAVCCPDKDALLCTIADTRLDSVGVQRIYNAFFEEVYPFIGTEDMFPCRWELAVRPLPNRPEYELPPTGVYRFASNPLGLRALSLNGGELTLENGHGLGVLRFGLGCQVRDTFPGAPHAPTLCSGGYIGPGKLRIRCFVIGDAPCGVELLLVFAGEYVTVKARRSVDPVTVGFDGVASGKRGIENSYPSQQALVNEIDRFEANWCKG